MNVRLTTQALTNGTRQLKLEAAYHPSLPGKARAIGGRWHADTKTWRFDLRDEQRVRDLCVEVYGIDPFEPPAELVTVRVPLDSYRDDVDEVWMAGRRVARRAGRDYDVQLGAGVIVVAGGFPRSGGSVKYPRISPREGTVLEIRELPRLAAEKLVAGREGAEIVATIDAPAGRPVGAAVNGTGAYAPEIAAVIEAFRALSATQQAIALAALSESLPDVV